MEKIVLNGTWRMKKSGDSLWSVGMVPGSVYNDLMLQNKMQDPFYRENEDEALKLCSFDYEYERDFDISKDHLTNDSLLLCCDGLDTLCDIYINGIKAASTFNMHTSYELDIKQYIFEGSNTIKIQLFSPMKFIARKQNENPTWGAGESVEGFQHLRKAHYMFGWDWGPQLPDMGIWRDIYIGTFNKARLKDIYITQHHEFEKAHLEIMVKHQPVNGSCICCSPQRLFIEAVVTSPDGNTISKTFETLQSDNCIDLCIENPLLWWPNGFGSQPLYKVEVFLRDEHGILDYKDYIIGLRKLTVKREKDQWGESFEYNINGISIFAMGADYIPEDSILARTNPQRTEQLIKDCVEANFNSIRVWGGGIYPPDYFFDLCDRYGLVVWQDLMFACAVYDMNESFAANIRKEIEDNMRRIRHHASLGLWCGNNEMEFGWVDWDFPKTDKLRADYIKQFEVLLPQIAKDVDPNTFYWPASPSSGGNFDNPNDSDRGDVHYWEVWHSNKPFTDYRKYYFRFLSEFGFQSLPSIKTVSEFTLPEDRNLFSPVMEKHQKNGGANGKIMYYLAANLKYPKDFESLIYASQVLQADAIRYGVEHFRRHRGRCMGAIYWQLNDCWPVISWSSIDYYGRWKALHYSAKRFFAPVLISACEEGNSAGLNVSNETTSLVEGIVQWSLRDNKSKIVKQGAKEVNIPALSARDVEQLEFSENLCSKEALRSHYLEYSLKANDEILSSGTVIFVPMKHFEFIDPKINAEVSEIDDNFTITLCSKSYARFVALDLTGNDCRFSDNYFDISAGEAYAIKVEKESLNKPITLEEFRRQMTVRSMYDIT